MARDLQSLLTDIERKGLENDAAETERARKYLNITKDTGELLQVLVKTSGARRVLEIGTSNGYSTLWLANALGPSGMVTTLEHDPHKIEEAQHYFLQAGLAERIDIMQGDATALLTILTTPFDFIFLDADRSAYMTMLPDLTRLLASGGLLVCDNAISHQQELQPFMNYFIQETGFDTALVPVGKGEFLIYKH